jgi:alkylhydroperoxidase family enzyme
VPKGLEAFVDRLALHAYRITDDELAALKAAGFTEEQLYDAVAAGAFGAAWARLEAGLDALEGRER